MIAIDLDYVIRMVPSDGRTKLTFADGEVISVDQGIDELLERKEKGVWYDLLKEAQMKEIPSASF